MLSFEYSTRTYVSHDIFGDESQNGFIEKLEVRQPLLL